MQIFSLSRPVLIVVVVGVVGSSSLLLYLIPEDAMLCRRYEFAPFPSQHQYSQAHSTSSINSIGKCEQGRMHHINRPPLIPRTNNTTDIDLAGPLTDHFNIDIIIAQCGQEFACDANTAF